MLKLGDKAKMVIFTEDSKNKDSKNDYIGSLRYRYCCYIYAKDIVYIYGKIISSDGGLFTIKTPDGLNFVSGMAWVRELETEDYALLEKLERAVIESKIVASAMATVAERGLG